MADNIQTLLATDFFFGLFSASTCSFVAVHGQAAKSVVLNRAIGVDD